MVERTCCYCNSSHLGVWNRKVYSHRQKPVKTFYCYDCKKQFQSEYLTPEQRREQAERMGKANRKLSDLEIEQVAKLRLKGYTLEEIASHFSVAGNTIRRHLNRLNISKPSKTYKLLSPDGTIHEFSDENIEDFAQQNDLNPRVLKDFVRPNYTYLKTYKKWRKVNDDDPTLSA